MTVGTVVSAMATDLLDDARRDASLSIEDLWFRYIEIGGTATLAELSALLSGESFLPASDHDVIAQALNERLWELDRNALVRYADTTTIADEISQVRAYINKERQGTTRAPTISVVIPTLNEAKNLPFVLKQLPDEIDEVIIVDGLSTDNTVAVARACRPDVKIVLQDKRGKGNALACGFRAVTCDITVMLDADGSTDPAEIPRFVAALVAGADVAKGSRFAPGGGSDDMTFLRRIGNTVLTKMVNTIWRVRYTDLCYGYMAFWSRKLASVYTDCNGFEVETLMNIRIAVSGLTVTEVASFEAERRFGASNLRVARDGTRVLRTIVAEFARPI